MARAAVGERDEAVALGLAGLVWAGARGVGASLDGWVLASLCLAVAVAVLVVEGRLARRR